VGRSWRLDETDVKIKGKSAYLYRAVDKDGYTIDFLLTPNRDRDAAETFLQKVLRTPGLPEKIPIDWSGANTAAITHYNQMHETAIVIRHCQYLNHIVEQDHRAVKRLTRTAVNTMGEYKYRQIREWEGHDDCGGDRREAARCVCAGDLTALALGRCDFVAVGVGIAAEVFSASLCRVSRAKF
jgi:hypothetical protein